MKISEYIVQIFKIMRIYHAQDSKIYQIAQWYRNTGRKVYQGSVQAKPSYSEV